MTERPSILLVEDHGLIAQGLQFALQSRGYEVGTVVTQRAEAVVAAVEDARPDLVLLDLQLGETTDGKDLIAPIQALGSKVMVLTGVTDRRHLAECVEAGVDGLASKAEPFEAVLDKVERLFDGLAVNPPAEREEMLAELRRLRRERADQLAVFSRLSARENEVLAMIVEGMSAEAMATKSFVSMTTIRSQIRAILQKLGVNSQLAAVALVRSTGWQLGGDEFHQR